MHVYEVRPRKDHRGVDLISDALPFGGLWYGEPDAISNAIGYAKFRSPSHDAVIRVFDEAVNVIETHEHAWRIPRTVMYNLTPSQKALLRSIVEQVRAKQMPEEFTFMWGTEGGFLHYEGAPGFYPAPDVTKGALDALAANHLLHIRTEPGDKFGARYCTLTGKAYEAVDSNFAAPDISFVRHLTPLADITALDTELKHRCLPILGTGAADPKLWDSAVRTAGVILEERLRDVGAITDPHAVGRDLVNKVFGKTGTLAGKFAQDAEREGHRDLYAGVVGAFRNPSAHRLVDPTPHEGGAFIVFVNLLLKKLDDLR